MAILTLFLMTEYARQFQDVKDEVEVYEIYITKLHADLAAHGFDPPPMKEMKNDE